jgi:hypothetical protein
MAHATAELAAAMVPVPDDIMEDLGPLAAVWYLHEVAWSTFRHYTAMLSADGVAAPEDDSEPVRAHHALGLALGMLDQTCVILGLIEPDAAVAP